jgi:hypothetical protein
MNLREFVHERLGGILLEIANERYIPGALLDIERESGFAYILKEIGTVSLYKQKFIVRRLDGFVWEFTGESEQIYESDLVAGNMVQEEIKHELGLEAAASVPQYGITLSGALNTKLNAVLRVGKIQARVFRKAGVAFEGMQGLLRLKGRDLEKWEWVNGDYLVTEAYYTTSIKYTFYAEGDIRAKVDFERAGFTASGSTSAKWLDYNVLEISGEPSVPFAVRGIWL